MRRAQNVAESVFTNRSRSAMAFSAQNTQSRLRLSARFAADEDVR